MALADAPRAIDLVICHNPEQVDIRLGIRVRRDDVILGNLKHGSLAIWILVCWQSESTERVRPRWPRVTRFRWRSRFTPLSNNC